ncbi:MAG: RsmB/NOP family class I SAM-dependent RNA methyltransferase [Armatimonadetes bacterium]|nr:RsmB/NOP family class I SAM-dependent RNA methyltransferase [Armatimonadota bacterium]MBX3109516.1 RsmB/NOP family class I SAM-dependent RNA methyltransferase [Fimbriimonadaceae bacterium]
MPARHRAVVWPQGRSGSVGGRGPDWWPDCCELVDASVRMGDLPEHTDGRVYSLDPSSVFEGGILQGVLAGFQAVDSRFWPEDESDYQDSLPKPGEGREGLAREANPDAKRGESGQDSLPRLGQGLGRVCRGKTLVIDVCASPGGKSMLAHAILRPGILICNEAIGKRLGMLKSNLERCGIAAETRNLDPGRLAEEFEGQADVVIVDAPCSGQSVLVKGGENPGCFNPRTVESNAMRQRRILSESARMVAPGGWLMYSTCTYSLQENERLIEWFLARNPGFAEAEFAPYAPYKSPFGPGYREWPHAGLGVGGFTCLLTRRP